MTAKWKQCEQTTIKVTPIATKATKSTTHNESVLNERNWLENCQWIQ